MPAHGARRDSATAGSSPEKQSRLPDQWDLYPDTKVARVEDWGSGCQRGIEPSTQRQRDKRLVAPGKREQRAESMNCSMARRARDSQNLWDIGKG